MMRNIMNKNNNLLSHARFTDRCVRHKAEDYDKNMTREFPNLNR